MTQQELLSAKGTEQLRRNPMKRIFAEQRQVLPSQLMQVLQAWMQALLRQRRASPHTDFWMLVLADI